MVKPVKTVIKPVVSADWSLMICVLNRLKQAVSSHWDLVNLQEENLSAPSALWRVG